MKNKQVLSERRPIHTLFSVSIHSKLTKPFPMKPDDKFLSMNSKLHHSVSKKLFPSNSKWIFCVTRDVSVFVTEGFP